MNGSLNLTDLFARIGMLTMENEMLTAENARLHAMVEAQEATTEAEQTPQRKRRAKAPAEATE